MSLRTWVSAYCPTKTIKAGQGSWMTALKRAHRYYTGILQPNLERHKLRRQNNMLLDATNNTHVFGFGSNAVCNKARYRCTRSSCKLYHGGPCLVYDPQTMICKLSGAIKRLSGGRTV